MSGQFDPWSCNPTQSCVEPAVLMYVAAPDIAKETGWDCCGMLCVYGCVGMVI